MEVIQLSLFGKMFQERSAQTAEKTSAPCWKNLPAWNNQTLQFLDLRGGADGAKPERLPEMDGPWLGDSSTLNIGECPREENGSLLSWILQVDVPEKYYLSAKACRGILNRASRRGKKLQELLETALLEMIEWWASRGGQAYTLKIRSGCAGGGKGALVQTEKTGTLSTLQDQTLFQAIPVLNDQGGEAMSVSYNITGTLRAAEHGHQPIVFESNAQPIVLESNQIHATVTQTGICPTLPASMGMGGGYIPMITDRKVFDARGNGGGKIALTITGDHKSRISDYTAIAVDLYNGAVTGDTAAAITCRSTAPNSGPKVIESYGIGNGQAHSSATKEKSGTLDTMHDAQAVAIECSGCLNPWDTQARRVYGEDGAFPALPSRGTAGGNQQAVLAGQRTRWIVRRLTPTECERLQGYPDGWTDIGEWTDTKGKKHKAADSPRYKALGNSIALPQWLWIAQKMKQYLPAGATLGGLFDGIGGFPLVWETTYGKGTARWASEIEEFPIAVTKKHFPERNECEN